MKYLTKRSKLKRTAVAFLAGLMAVEAVSFPTMANTLETPTFANESSPISEIVDVDYILDALSNANLSKEFNFFPLEETDRNLRRFDSRSNLLEFDTVEEAIEFFKELSRVMEYPKSITYIDSYDSHTDELMSFMNRINRTGTASGMVEGGAWTL